MNAIQKKIVLICETCTFFSLKLLFNFFLEATDWQNTGSNPRKVTDNFFFIKNDKHFENVLNNFSICCLV